MNMPVNNNELAAVINDDSTAMDSRDLSLSLDKLLHDLRAPIVNSKGFRQEIFDAMAELKSVTDSCTEHLDAAQVDRIRELHDEDLQPCLKFLFDAIDILEARVQEFSDQYPQ